jgi:hypothetical protein
MVLCNANVCFNLAFLRKGANGAEAKSSHQASADNQTGSMKGINPTLLPATLKIAADEPCIQHRHHSDSINPYVHVFHACQP